MKSVAYMGGILVAFVGVIVTMRFALGAGANEAFGFTVAIIGIAIGADIARRIFSGDESKRNRGEQAQIRDELNELKKSVAEVREYVTELYIQQHDQKMNDKKGPL